MFVVLFVLSGFFSGTEIALMSLSSHKIESLYKSKVFGANYLKLITENTDRLLITILIGNNLVNTYVATLAAQIAIGIAKSSGMEEAQALGIATGIITFLLLMFGEIIPKSVATKNAEKISLLVAPMYRFMMVVLAPVVFVIELLVKIFSKGTKTTTITGEEIESFIAMGRLQGGLDEEQYEKMRSILEFDDTSVEEIMTPRVKLDAIPNTMSVEEAMNFYLTHSHSRLPVYDETIDKIDYFITARDLLKEYKNNHKDKKLSELKLRKVLKVPINQSISKVFTEFRNGRKVFAIIMDEYGGVAGLVSTEDVIEEVFWEIHDESDRETESAIQTGEDSYVFESDVSIEDILYEFDLQLENIWLDNREFNWETLSYVITHLLEGFPEKWQTIPLDIIETEEEAQDCVLELQVLEIEDATIGKVAVRRIEQPKIEKK